MKNIKNEEVRLLVRYGLT